MGIDLVEKGWYPVLRQVHAEDRFRWLVALWRAADAEQRQHAGDVVHELELELDVAQLLQPLRIVEAFRAHEYQKIALGIGEPARQEFFCALCGLCGGECLADLSFELESGESEQGRRRNQGDDKRRKFREPDRQ